MAVSSGCFQGMGKAELEQAFRNALWSSGLYLNPDTKMEPGSILFLEFKSWLCYHLDKGNTGWDLFKTSYRYSFRRPLDDCMFSVFDFDWYIQNEMTGRVEAYTVELTGEETPPCVQVDAKFLF